MRRSLSTSRRSFWNQRLQHWVSGCRARRRMRRAMVPEALETRCLLSAVYASADVLQNIPDRGQIVSTLNVADSLTIGDINVTLDIDHTRDKDLDVFLIAPDGTRVQLMTDVGGNGNNFQGTTLDDEAASSITSGSAPFSGSYRPEGSLSDLDGQDAQGTWALEITDDQKRETGTLIGWSIEVTSAQPALPAISIDDVQLAEGDSGTTAFVVTVRRSGDTSGTSSVDFTTVDGTATAGSDYVANSGTLQFLADETTKTISVQVNGDADIEPDESFTVELANPTNATIADATGQGTILDDDAPLGITIDDVIAIEGDDSMRFIDVFVTPASGGLRNARGIEYGPDGNLYVSGESDFSSPDFLGFVNRYDGETGAFIDVFATDPSMTGAKDVEFGPDGNLYVTNNVGDNVYRFDGTTGAFIDVFVPVGSGGLETPRQLIFGPDGNGDGNQDLYVASAQSDNILRYDGVTGAFLGAFVTTGSGGLNDPTAITFGPDGSFYVASGAHSEFFNSILRYDGTSGDFLNIFVDAGSAGLTLAPTAGMIFGPDVNSDGTADMYVSNGEIDEVLIYSGTDGSFLQTFITSGHGGLHGPKGLLFDNDGNLLVVSGVDHSVRRFGAASQAVFTVSLSSPSADAVTVDFNTVDGTATAGSDYTAAGDTIVFAAGVTQRTILVPTIDDGLEESTETFDVVLSNAVGANIVDPVGIVTIADNESQPTVVFADSFEVGEWNGNWVEDSQDDWARKTQRATDGSYSAEVDGSANNATLTTADAFDLSGYAANTLTFSWYIESGFDSGEYLAFDISQNDGSTWQNNVLRLNGNQDQENTWHHETVDLAPYLSSDLRFRFRAKANKSNEDANVDNVRLVASGVAGASTAFLEEEEETSILPDFRGNVDNPSEGGFIDHVKIVGTPAVPGLPGISIDDVQLAEGDDDLVFIDRFIPDTGLPGRYRNLRFGPDGNADGHDDLYVVNSDTDEVRRFDGISGTQIDVFVTAGSGGLDDPLDLRFGPDGHLYVTSRGTNSNPDNNNVLRFDGQTGAFIDTFATGLQRAISIDFGDDGHLYAANRDTNTVQQFDGVTGQSLGTFIAAAAGKTGSPRQATFGEDLNGDGVRDLYVADESIPQILRYDGTDGSLLDSITIPASYGVIGWIDVGEDGSIYATTSFELGDHTILRLDGGTGTISGEVALGRQGWSIMVDANDIVYVGGNPAGTIVDRLGPASAAAFEVSLSEPSDVAVVVDFATANGTAVAGSDYDATSGTIVFEPGVTTRMIIVPTIDDSLAEPDETFFVNLTNPTDATIVDTQGVGTIADDDPIVNRFTKIAHETGGGPTLADDDQFGATSASLGDLDGDGIGDMAVAAIFDDTGGFRHGAVYVQFMNTDGSVKSFTKIAHNTGGGPTLADDDRFGNSLAALGDLDGDGIGELAVGARQDDSAGADRGAVYVLFLNADGTVKSTTKIASGIGGGPTLADSDTFGSGVAALDDLNGDGIPDLAVGAHEDDTGGNLRGAVYVLFLDTDGTAKSTVKIASDTGGGPTLLDGGRFGRSAAALGDVDGDGITDLAVSAPGDGTGGFRRGAVYVLFLNADGTVKSTTKIAHETGGGPTLADVDVFGTSVGLIGDLDGDGHGELAVGAHEEERGDRGAVYVLFLNADGAAKSFAKIASDVSGGPMLADGDLFGSSVASLGDLDGDGTTELAVGARRDDTGGTNRGAVYVMSLNVEPDVPIPSIIDNGDAGYASTGFVAIPDAIFPTPEGRDGDIENSQKGTGNDVATWTFSGLSAGTYRVSATWSTHENRATNAPYSIIDGASGALLAKTLVDQEQEPNDFSDDGSDWEDLGVVTITGDTLIVELTDEADQYVIADAVRIVEVATPPETLGPLYIDDGDDGYADSGWDATPILEGRLNDIRYAQAGNGSQTANWTFSGLEPGNYTVAATWSAHANRATDAPFTILNGAGGDVLEVIHVDQQQAPGDFTDNGSSWHDLTIVTISGTELVVELSNDADGYVIADAIRIEPTDDEPANSPGTIIDDGDTEFSTTVGWNLTPVAEGRGDDIRYAAPGNGSRIATWTFTGLTAGTYRVSATWSAHANRASDAPYTLYDGATPLVTVDVDQKQAPDDFTTQGSTWEDLTEVEITGDTLVVELSNDANGYVIADAIRVHAVT